MNLKVPFTFVFSAIIFVASAQNLPKKLKYDELIYSTDSTYAAVIKGKKAGIYNLSQGEFAIPMTKGQTIVHSPLFNIYTVIKKDGYKSYEAFNPEMLKELNQFNTMVGGAKFEIDKLDEDRLLITDVGYPFAGVSNDGVFAFDYEKPVEGSGVYNCSTKEWEVPQKYSEIFKINNTLFALKHQSTDFEYKNDVRGNGTFEGYYDLYSMSNDAWTLSKENVKAFNDVPVLEVFGYGNVETIEDVPNHYLGIKKNGKKDYFIFDLFTDGLYWHPEVSLKIVRSDIEFATTHPEEHLIITYASKDSLPIALYGYLADKKPYDTSFVFLLEAGKERVLYGVNDFETFKIYCDNDERMISMVNINEGTVKMNFGIRKLNNDYIKVYNSSYEKFKKMQSLQYPMEDSINFGGNVVYDPQGSTSSTGIFNVKTGKWEIEPRYYDCYLGKTIKILGHLDVADDSQKEFWVKYNLISPKGNVGSGFTMDDLVHNQHILQEILWEVNADTLYRATGNESDYLNDRTYYFERDKQIGTVEINDLMLGYYQVFGPAEFVYTNSLVGFNVFLENDSIELKLGDKTYSVPGTSGKISLRYNLSEKGQEGNVVEIFCITAEDTVSFKFEDDHLNTVKTSASFTINDNGRLIIRDSVSSSVSYEFREEDSFRLHEALVVFTPEKSAIWELKNGSWTKVSPYYANIDAIPNGYICLTGNVYYDDWNSSDDYMDMRYVILDDSLEPLSFIDYYDFPLVEDLGFGLKVCTDKGCMFVTYDYQMVTQDDWDEFRLAPDGRLMAIRNPPDKVTDEETHVRDGVVGYFKIPTK